MLTRLRFRRDFRVIIRYFSDKPSDSDGKITEKQPKTASKEAERKPDSSTEKIQALLKSMMSEPLTKEAEYRANFASAPDVRRQRKNDEIEVKVEKIEESITKAAGDVAQALGGDVKQAEAELLSKVLGKINQTSTSLSDLLVGMKVDHSKGEERPSVHAETRGEQVKRIVRAKEGQRQQMQQTRPRQDMKQERPPTREKKSIPQPTTVNIFSGEPLNIFKRDETKYGTELPVWERLKQREVALATTQQPANYFQKMIVWTDQGKIWKFPIDNEQGLEEEANVHFSEHVFLDAYLEGWCPKKGPIRHFMELVCVGLSKNPFYTAKEKKDHIMWYKEYFESKKDILTDVGAWEVGKSKEASV